jgi:hypothetical protein
LRLFALISWFDETPKFLSACVSSLALAGVDHVIAVDGAYFLLEDAKPRSGREQWDALHYTADALGMGITIHGPTRAWSGNEVEKRAFMFGLAESVSELHQDWWFVMDADQVVSDVPNDLHERLAQTDHDVGETMFWERMDPHETEAKAEQARVLDWPHSTQYPIRNFFRALPGLSITHNHFTYTLPDGRRLWGNATAGDTLEPAVDLTDLRIEHRTQFRDLARRQQQQAYYDLRQSLGVEAGDCHLCGERAVKMVPFDFDKLNDGKYAAGWVEVCTDCEPELDKRNRARLRYLGYDEETHGPLQLDVVKGRNGRHPKVAA